MDPWHMLTVLQSKAIACDTRLLAQKLTFEATRHTTPYQFRRRVPSIVDASAEHAFTARPRKTCGSARLGKRVRESTAEFR